MWHDDIICSLRPLKGRIKAFTVKKDNFYTVVISDALRPDKQASAWQHEVDHIRSGDFDSDRSADRLELIAHTSR